ncbi:hypothetical protein ASG42_11160 [Rhizobium sp. Leaf391]|uniref:hypothetical protein n=1 Tax=Rhizobium sp. Leaf391 TaxID=1736360 RepID=UPI0007158C8D|nr:hypothetical protein [Rhizobium sp. Leaf391]KQS91247.1 hypothetical protein ASG42_11160 [Rhizobium sp. Leaf391]
MLYVSLSLCVIVSTFLVGRFFAAKTRLVEKDIEDAIARKLSTSSLNVELLRLKEENGVMRNLLIDMVENEASVAQAAPQTPDQKNRAMNARTQRRREIFGEAVFALQAGNVQSTARNLKING